MTVHVEPVDLGPGVRAWFTGRADGEVPVGRAGNLSHRRPHQPERLALDRAAAFGRDGVAPHAVHLLQQVHGADVAVVDESTPVGAELPGVDAAVTARAERPLAVLTADCVPVLLAAGPAIGVAHAGRVGLLAGVVSAAVTAVRTLADAPLVAAVGPAIGPCCYEVPAAMAADAEDALPGIAARTTWGTPSLDLPGAAARQLADLGAAVVALPTCTRCDADQRWFSHRADPEAGRQAGVIVRVAA